MILGVNAWNIRSGGGLTHLREVLAAMDVREAGFSGLRVAAPVTTLAQLTSPGPLERVPLSQHRAMRWASARRSLRGCQVVFSPGGYPAVGNAAVVMIQNALPFEEEEISRFPRLSSRARYHLLRWLTAHAVVRARGVVCLTEHGAELLKRRGIRPKEKVVVIPHGAPERFFSVDRVPAKTGEQHIVYVSAVNHYKHQDLVVRAVARLRTEGLRCTLAFAGSGEETALQQLSREMRRHNAQGWCEYLGVVAETTLLRLYESASAFVFASTCEALPITLVEAMAAGLPIACSSKPPMPEVAGQAVLYFTPGREDELINALRAILTRTGTAERLSVAARDRARTYRWKRTAADTLAFLGLVAGRSAAGVDSAAAGPWRLKGLR